MRRKWIGKPSPKSMRFGHGWVSEMNKVYVDENQEYCVMYRSINTTEFGEEYHACIRNAQETDIPWSEKQKIKNEIFGDEYIALEVFPRESELVDEANMYHLWVFKNTKLSFSLKE